MKKKYKGLLALTMSMALVLTACGSNDDMGSGEGSQGEMMGADDSIEGKISVQVEDAWQDYYQAAADRVKEKYPNAEIEFINTSSFDHLDVLDQTDATNEDVADLRSEEHTSELQSRFDLVCRLLLEKKKMLEMR